MNADRHTQQAKRIGFFLGSILLLALLCSACRTPPPPISADRASFAADYYLQVPDLTIHLKLRHDGTYELSQDNWGKEETESGTWSTVEGDVTLRPQVGKVEPPIRRLRPDRNRDGDLSLVEPNGKATTKLPALTRAGQK